MIIGITGTNGAGKDTVAHMLAQKLSWPTFSLSDELREIARERGLGLDRTSLVNLGNEMRAKHGSDYLAERILNRVGNNFIASSIRNPVEIEPFRKRDDFILLFVDAPIKQRYKRTTRGRGRAGEGDLSFADFIVQEKRELEGGFGEQQTKAVCDMADVKVDNSGTIEELGEKLDKFLKEVRHESTKLG